MEFWSFRSKALLAGIKNCNCLFFPALVLSLKFKISMTTWGNICRICSSPADYEIFAKIPTYLHGSTNEFLNWQKPINILLEETTGLKNSTDDGLPRNICAPCISYLKHAVTFREQCIKNALSLKLADLYQQKRVNISDSNKIDKESALFTADDLRFVEQRPVHNLLLNNSSKLESSKDKVHKRLLNQAAPQLEGSPEQRIEYLNVLFNKQQHHNVVPRHSRETEMPTSSAQNEDEEDDYAVASSSDDNEEAALLRKHKNCYNYSETNFEEDDPMEQDQLQLRDIKVNIPEPMWKERKCPACSKRFMFEDSQQSHLDNCVEYQFVTFVNEVTKLLDIRRQKMVSPHEFIRRMIFALHKTCTWLQEHSIDSRLAEKLNQVKLSNSEKTVEPTIPLEIPDTRTVEQPFAIFDFSNGTTTPITEENNVLYAIERSESRNSQSTPTVKKPIPIRGIAAGSSLCLVSDKHKERATFLEKLQRAAVSPGSISQAQAPIFSARCGQCNLVFDSVSELEVHNHNVHRGNELNADDEAKRRQIIALFEDDI
ncbi:uncharacterized protein LOC108102617 [Drosophila eugracilis]|uniref:uncharacterized protein LOC108102617 n=1 Tax=Drosophila eugracilis TaxID=29029 RepID=UPI0007E6FA61|nr:uncharacterized protein LOC108102617 [Drosophila eugracilis]